MTRHIRELADAFVETQRMDDGELAERIRSDGVDILVVLAGHTARNRLLAAARKPAPILVSYADFSTTGLAAMDYWLTDPIVHPEGQTGERFTETLMRVPMMVLHRPIDVAPPVTTLPARERGHVTFGSCNNPAKIGAGVLDLWAAILSQVPRSRLALKYRKVYEVPDVRARIRGRFAERGVDPDRVVFIGGDVDRASHLALVGEMDVALDPFPFNGCTTTFEALWMGVPVVTLAGRRFLGRMGTSFLTHLGMPELVAPTPEAYVGTAVALSADLDRLAAIRSGLRDRVMASPLCDGPAYARSIEAAFRAAWRRWCESRQ
jgi:protein O-GlcNAc transferase